MYRNSVFCGDYPQELLGFYHQHYPQRDAKKYLDFLLKSTPYKDVYSTSVVGYNDNEIKAEILSIISKYNFKGESDYCIFGCDYIVSLDQRNSPLGATILRKLIKNKIHFGIGPKEGSVSYQLHSIYGDKHFTNYDIFISPNWKKPFSILRSMIKGCINKNIMTPLSMPKVERLEIGNYKFSLIDDENLISSVSGYKEKWMDNNVFEFDRSVEYLRWRFFHAPYKYYFYECRDHKGGLKGYAVFRPIRFKSYLETLSLVDYRFVDEMALKSIIKFGKYLVGRSNLSFLLISNSLEEYSDLFNSEFKKIYYYPVLSNYNKISEIKSSFITFADADGELNK
jgi:hypothetical protein